MGCCASKQTNELSQRSEERRQQTPASTSDTFMNNVHPSCGTDNESVDLAGALALLRSNILDPFGAAHSDNRVDVKDLLKKLKTVLTFGSPSTIVAALCLLSTSKFTDDKLSGEVVEDMLKKSFGEHQGSDSRVSLTAVSSSSRFKAWCAAAGFDMTSVTNQDIAQVQRAEIFNEFEELSRLCASGGAQSAMCLLRSSWLQEQLAEAQRTGTPFVMPSRGALPEGASHSGTITKDTVFILVLSYCWAGPGQPDPRNKLLCDVCRFLAYLDDSRHFGDDVPVFKEVNLGDREVLLFWDYPCLYQKSDTSTGGVTFLQLDSFERGLASINVLYGHVETLSLLCTQNYPIVERKGYKESAWPYFEMLVSTFIKDANMAVDLPTALEWIRRVGSDPDAPESNRSIYWLYQCVRRAERQLPVAPDTFDGEIAHKHATNGSDVDFLKKKFRQTFQAVMRPAKKIDLKNVPGPTPAQWRLFLEVTLCECPRLVHVDLSHNEAITDATLQPFAALHDSLEFLSVGMSAGFRGSLEPLRNLHKLRELYLCGCVALEGSVEPLSGLQALVVVNLEACFGLVAGLDLLSALPQLQFVNTCDTQLDAASFVAQRQRVLQLPEAAVAIEAGGVVVVGGCRVLLYGDGTTPLCMAAFNGQVKTVLRLLSGRDGRGGVEVDRANASDGSTPLVEAASHNFPEVVEVLLEHRADANKGRHDGGTPLMFAAQKGSEQVAKLLLAKGADVNEAEKQGKTPLYFASSSGHKDVVVTLLAAGADVNKAAQEGQTPLIVAIYNGHKDLVVTLLAAGADVNKAEKAGQTPLIVASQRGHKDMVVTLLAAGADVNKATQGQTPLLFASKFGHKDVVVTLLAAGADKTAEWQGWNALSVARHLGHREISALLA